MRYRYKLSDYHTFAVAVKPTSLKGEKTMTNSMMRWHLARDNQTKLAKFCESNKVKSDVKLFDDTFNITYEFDNNGSIEVELLRGKEQGYSVADHFQVVDYAWGTK